MSESALTRTSDMRLPMGILSASIAPDASALVAGCMDGVYHLDLKSKQHEKLYAHDSYVSSACWDTANDRLVSAGYDGSICWFDTAERKETRRLKTHDFWSWDMAMSPDGKWIASVTGQYLAGGYKYEPKPESEPSVKVISRETGEAMHSLSHVPSVQAVAFSNDSRLVAAGNLMGEVRVWDTRIGEMVTRFKTEQLTSWGIIKSHCYLGGVFAIKFTPDDREILICGMGPMRDPMAGNGKQRWEKWSLELAGKDGQAKRIAETNPGEAGEGLMETLAIHPDGKRFVMGGRLRGGKWNVAMFDLETGKRGTTLKTGYRVTEANFSEDGKQLVLVGAQGQPKKNKKGGFDDFGRVEIYDVPT